VRWFSPLLCAFSRLFCLSSCLFLLGCISLYPVDKIDPAGGLTRQDYLALRNRGEKDQSKAIPDESDDLPPEPMAAPVPEVTKEPPIPALPVAERPIKPALPQKTITLSVSDSVPLRDVLIELGREGNLNLEIDPRIQGGILFSAYDQPFDEVLRHVCALAGLRYREDGKFIRIELDEPYQESYPLDILSLSRHTTSEVTIATNVFDVDTSGTNGDSSSSKSGSDNNSTAKISSKAEADFWTELEKSLPRVLETNRKSMGGGKANAKSGTPSFSIDKQAGLVTVYGNSLQHETVQHYLAQLRRKTSAQVLIEARIIEVELSDDFQSGVNWSVLFKGAEGISANFGSAGASSALSSADSGLFAASLDSKDFTGLLKLVRTFGTTRVLSSPRLTVMNNQTAVLKVARNEVYFVTSAQFPTTVTSTGATVSGTPVFSSTPRTVPVGLVMTVQPAVNAETGRVTLTLRPTISRVVDRVVDPSIGLNAAYAGVTDVVQSKVPVLAVREMDSVLQLRSGEVGVMGGLMQDSSDNQDQGVPGLDTLPLIGNLAKSRSNSGDTSELVILLRATILENPEPDPADKMLYERYNNDPRPLYSSAEPTEPPHEEP